MSMNDLKKLPINTENSFDELPQEVSVSFDLIDSDLLVVPDELFDQETPGVENTVFDSLLPFIVLPNNSNTYTIVDGCKRYLQWQRGKHEKISCTIIHTPLTGFEAGLLRIALNQNRPQHLREKFLILSWLKKNCKKDAFESTAHKAGFSPKDIVQLTPLLSCDTSIKEALFEGSLDVSHIKYFQVLTYEDQVCFLKTFKNLRLSLQTQREFLEWLPEIAYVKNITVSAILAESQIQETLENKVLNAPQKIDKIRSLLYFQKFPQLSDAQNIWMKHAAALNPDPSCVNFVPNPYFEKNQLEVHISITNAQNAVSIFDKLATISLDEWQKFIYPLE